MNFILTTELTLLVSGLSILSGVGSYLQRVRDKQLVGGLQSLLTEIITAISAGLFIAYVGHSQDWNEAATCALVILVSNNGTDTMAYMKKIIKQQVNQRFGLVNPNSNNGA